MDHSSASYSTPQAGEDSEMLNKVTQPSRSLRMFQSSALPESVEELKKIAEKALADLDQKERDVAIAAKFGSTLLQNNDKLQSDIAELHMIMNGTDENMKKLQQTIAEQSTHNAQLRTNNYVLSNQIKDAQEENQYLMEAVKKIEQQLEEAGKKNRSIHQLQEQKRDLEQEMERYYTINEEYETLKQKSEVMDSKYKHLQQTIHQQSLELTDVREQVSELTSRIEIQQEDQIKLQNLSRQLKQAEKATSDLKEEKRILEEMPLLSQFSETSSLRMLLLQNRALLENVEFAEMENQCTDIVDVLIRSTSNSCDANELDGIFTSDGKPTNAFYMLTAILMKKKCEDIEKQLSADSSMLQEMKEELNELRMEKNTFTKSMERAEKKKDKLEEKFHAAAFKHEESITILQKAYDDQENTINHLKEQMASQSQKISHSQFDNDERLKRRLEELAVLEVMYKEAKFENNNLNESLKTLRNQLNDAKHRNGEFQEIVHKLNLEKGDISQQLDSTLQSNAALLNTKEKQQEMLETTRGEHRAALLHANELAVDLVNLQELYDVSNEQIQCGREEVELVQSHNDLLELQLQKYREKNSKEIASYQKKIGDLNELIDMLRFVEEEQLQVELDAQRNQPATGAASAHAVASLKKENMDLKNRLHEQHKDILNLSTEKELAQDQISLLTESLDSLHKQRGTDQNTELQRRQALHDQINNLQERVASAETLRLEEISKLEHLKQRTFSDLQQQLTKEKSMNKANEDRMKRILEQNKDLDTANQKLVASMHLMIKDSGIECERIDELEDKLRRSYTVHQQDTQTIQHLTQKLKQMQQRMKLKRPYYSTLAPPTPLIISSFPDFTDECITEATEEKKVETEKSERGLLADTAMDDQTEKSLIQDVSSHILEVTESNNGTASQSLLLCKLINQVVPGTIDERAINLSPQNKEEEIENVNLCLNSAKAIGCDVGNIQALEILSDSTVLERLTWEIVRTELLSNVSVRKHPELSQLQRDLELRAHIVDLHSLTPEELLLQWVNYHIHENGKEISNFGTDLESLEVHHTLLTTLCHANHITLEPSFTTWNPSSTWQERVEIIQHLASELNCKKFLYPDEIRSGTSNLNVAFLANVFHHHSGLTVSQATLNEVEILEENESGTREERAFRLWINSLGIGEYVHNLHTDVRDGLILLRVLDTIEPGCVSWNRVNKNPLRMGIYRKIENCALCIQYGKELGFSLVGIEGKDIFDGNQTFILALVWQMMQLHLLGILRTVSADQSKPILEKDVVLWANAKVTKVNGKNTTVENLKSSKIQSSLFIAQLIDAIRPGAIRFEYIMAQESDYEGNAKYVISIARKIGCCIFLVWEDIVELRQKMIFTLVATLMLKDINSSVPNLLE